MSLKALLRTQGHDVRYVREYKGAKRWTLYFEPDSIDLKDPKCPRRHSLGSAASEIVPNLERAHAHYDEFKQLRRTGRAEVPPARSPTSRDMWRNYRGSEAFAKLAPTTVTCYEKTVAGVLDFECDNGIPYGDWPIGDLDRSKTYRVVRKLMERISERNGRDPMRSGKTTVKNGITALRTAYECVKLDQPDLLRGSMENPFSRLKLSKTGVKVAKATLPQTIAFIGTARAMGYYNLAVAALYEWETASRTSVVFHDVQCQDVRPGEIRVIDRKNGEEQWFPLYGPGREPLYPALAEWLPLVKGDRQDGMLFTRDHEEGHLPWPSKGGNMTTLYNAVRAIVRATPGLPEDFAMRSIRKGGIQEGADAGLTVQQIQAYSMHADSRVLERHYISRSSELVYAGRVGRLALRERSGLDMSPLDPATEIPLAERKARQAGPRAAIGRSQAVCEQVRSILEEAGSPLGVKAILDGLRLRGIELNGANPGFHLRTILYKRRADFPLVAGEGFTLPPDNTLRSPLGR